MESKLLSFVTSKDGSGISLHVDKAGLSLLISELTWSAQDRQRAR
jgi:hypothetical protein